MSKTRSHELLKRKAVHNFPFIFDLNVVPLNCQKRRECNETLGLLFPIHEHMQTHFATYFCKINSVSHCTTPTLYVYNLKLWCYNCIHFKFTLKYE